MNKKLIILVLSIIVLFVLKSLYSAVVSENRLNLGEICILVLNIHDIMVKEQNNVDKIKILLENARDIIIKNEGEFEYILKYNEVIISYNIHKIWFMSGMKKIMILKNGETVSVFAMDKRIFDWLQYSLNRPVTQNVYSR